jgi:predicted MFS family arabinose efflux permease
MGGTGMVTLVPALAASYTVSVGTVALAITAYMAPFAVVQLFSGSASQILTGRRTAALGYLVFTAASLGCAVAPSFSLFLLCRVVQGVGAAFLFPVLMALVGEVVAPARLGRAIGAFNATQTVGLTMGPLLAGLFEVHLGWRWFFISLGLCAAVSAVGFLRLFRAEHEAPGEGREFGAIMLTVLRDPTVVQLSLAAAGLFFAMIGSYTYLVAWLKTGPGLAEDRIGFLLAVAGAVGIPASAISGRWVDRFGRKPVGMAGMGGFIAALAGLALLPYSYLATLILTAWLGWTGAVAWTGLNTLAIEVLPALRKPVASIYNSVRFVGYALAPPLLGVIYGDGAISSVYVVSALVVGVAAVLLARLKVSPSYLPAQL